MNVKARMFKNNRQVMLYLDIKREAVVRNIFLHLENLGRITGENL